jgi:hypothetical protein
MTNPLFHFVKGDNVHRKCSYLPNSWLSVICLLDLFDFSWAQKHVLGLWISYCGTFFCVMTHMISEKPVWDSGVYSCNNKVWSGDGMIVHRCVECGYWSIKIFAGISCVLLFNVKQEPMCHSILCEQLNCWSYRVIATQVSPLATVLVLVDWLWWGETHVPELLPLRAYCSSLDDCDVDHGSHQYSLVVLSAETSLEQEGECEKEMRI